MRYGDDIAWLVCLSYFDGACAYCGTTNKKLTVDHLVAKSRGGTDDMCNLVPSCAACNHDKGDSDWRDWMLSQPNFSQERMDKVYSWRRVARQSGV